MGFSRFSSSKLVLKTVKSRFVALNYYENGSTREKLTYTTDRCPHLRLNDSDLMEPSHVHISRHIWCSNVIYHKAFCINHKAFCMKKQTMGLNSVQSLRQTFFFHTQLFVPSCARQGAREGAEYNAGAFLFVGLHLGALEYLGMLSQTNIREQKMSCKYPCRCSCISEHAYVCMHIWACMFACELSAYMSRSLVCTIMTSWTDQYISWYSPSCGRPRPTFRTGQA